MSEPKNAITFRNPGTLSDNSHEIARLWVTDGGASTVLVNPHRMPDAGLFGLLIADTVQHGATAYAKALGISEADALEQILRGFESGRRNPIPSMAIDDTGEEK